MPETHGAEIEDVTVRLQFFKNNICATRARIIPGCNHGKSAALSHEFIGFIPARAMCKFFAQRQGRFFAKFHAGIALLQQGISH